MRSKINAFIWLACLTLLVGTALWRHPENTPLIDSNILNLLPKNETHPFAQRAFNEVAQEMEDQVLFLISHPKEENALDAAKAFSNTLSTQPFFERISTGVSKEQEEAFSSFFAKAKAQLLTPEQKERIKLTPSLQTSQVIKALYNPFSGVTGAELSQDPFLLFREYLQEMNTQNKRFSIKDGFLVRTDDSQSYVLVRGHLSGSAYNLKIQENIPALLQIEKDTERNFSVKIHHTGVLFYAAFGAKSAKDEITSIGLGSIVGILLLVLIVYRSLLPLGLSLLSIGTGILCAFCVCLMVFGQIHLFSLVIGASLIGVSIDYAFHYLTERLLVGETWNPQNGLKNIFIPMTFGLLSTIIAYFSMLVAPFPGLQQLAVFSGAGLIGAYLCVICWYPLLAAKPTANKPLPLQKLQNAYLLLWTRKDVKWGATSAAFCFAILGLGLAHFNDDIKQLQSLPPSLSQQDARIQEITGLSQSQPMLLVTGENEQALLKNMSDLSGSLKALVAEGAISGYQSLSDFIPPIDEQKKNWDLVQHLYQKEAKALALTLGLQETPRFSAPFVPLLPEAFLSSLAGQAFAPLWLGKNETEKNTHPEKSLYAGVILLQEVTRFPAIQTLTKDAPHVTLLNKTQEISSLFGQYRKKIGQLMGGAFFLILFVLGLRFGFKRACFILMPPLLAVGAAFGAGALSPAPMNLFNLLGLFLVLGIGIDYSLFFAEQKDSRQALFANTLAASTSMLSFGLLCFSNTQAIHSFGLTVLFGIAVAWFLSPLAIWKHKTPCNTLICSH